MAAKPKITRIAAGASGAGTTTCLYITLENGELWRWEDGEDGNGEWSEIPHPYDDGEGERE